MAEILAVAAYPTTRRLSSKTFRIVGRMHPSVRGRMPKNSMALDTVGLSNWVSSFSWASVSMTVSS
jgi:hypothetical protein